MDDAEAFDHIKNLGSEAPDLSLFIPRLSCHIEIYCSSMETAYHPLNRVFFCCMLLAEMTFRSIC
ncbi:hypothetical protein LB505_012701 [Fusarium chuoi]|nr:hypothetical protein LB505_012701 [Fusarium chuoi]